MSGKWANLYNNVLFFYNLIHLLDNLILQVLYQGLMLKHLLTVVSTVDTYVSCTVTRVHNHDCTVLICLLKGGDFTDSVLSLQYFFKLETPYIWRKNSTVCKGLSVQSPSHLVYYVQSVCTFSQSSVLSFLIKFSFCLWFHNFFHLCQKHC